MSELLELQTSIGTWAVRTFPTASPSSWIAHLKLEVDELAEKQDPEEAADCLILLLGWCYKVGVDAREIIDAKMKINRQREWGEPDQEGIVRHMSKEKLSE